MAVLATGPCCDPRSLYDLFSLLMSLGAKRLSPLLALRARTSAFLSGSLSEFVKAPLEAPKTALKWCFPPLICFIGFCFQSAMLHMTTAKYVDLHFPDDLLNEELKAIPDVGHVLLGRGDLKMRPGELGMMM